MEGKIASLLLVKSLGMKNVLEPNERVEADDGLVGEDPDTARVPGSVVHHHDDQMMRVRCTARRRHETGNKRIKDWRIMAVQFTHEIEFHGACFRACATLTQLAIEFGKPLYQLDYYEPPVPPRMDDN